MIHITIEQGFTHRIDDDLENVSRLAVKNAFTRSTIHEAIRQSRYYDISIDHKLQIIVLGRFIQ